MVNGRLKSARIKNRSKKKKKELKHREKKEWKIKKRK